MSSENYYLVIKGKLQPDAELISEKSSKKGENIYEIRYGTHGKTYYYKECFKIPVKEQIKGPFILSFKDHDEWSYSEYDSLALIDIVCVPGEKEQRYILDKKEYRATRIYQPIGDSEKNYYFFSKEKMSILKSQFSHVFINCSKSLFLAYEHCQESPKTFNCENYLPLIWLREFNNSDDIILVKRNDPERIQPISFVRLTEYKSILSNECVIKGIYKKDDDEKCKIYYGAQYCILTKDSEKSIDPETSVISYGGRQRTNISEMEQYVDSDGKTYYRIASHREGKDDWIDICLAENVTIAPKMRDESSRNILSYLKEVASLEKLNVKGENEEDDDEETEEEVEANKINTISLGDKFVNLTVSDRSILSAYLKGDRTAISKSEDSGIVLFPFGCNHSQMEAVNNALSFPLSTIQGPPGTGKTQTILNIIANLIYRGHTVEVVSNNNSAVENILEKLDSKGMGFFVAQLGSKTNKELFIQNQPGELNIDGSWQIEDKKKYSEIEKEIARINLLLPELFEKDNLLHQLQTRLHDYQFQKRDFDDKYPDASSLFKKRTKFFLTNKEKVLLEKIIQIPPVGGTIKNRIISILQRIRRFIMGLPEGSALDRALDYISLDYDVKELTKQISSLESFLSAYDYDCENKRLAQLSLSLFKAALYERYAKSERLIFKAGDLWKNPSVFLKEYPVILSTTFSAVSALSKEVRYDYVIMDESSQVNVAAGVLSLSIARKAVIVGDEKQLPNVISDVLKGKINVITSNHNIPPQYDYVSNSFLSSVRKVLSPPNVTLREHYRCHPLIIEFCNREFYDRQLVVMTNGSFFDPVMVLKRTVEGNHQRGKSNQRQVDEIASNKEKWCLDNETVGIIAPFKSQVKLLNEKLPGIEIATVHKFQGREKDDIIFSTVENTIGKFVADPHLLNVAVSRAKGRFVLVASNEESKDVHMRNLMDFIRYYCKGESKGEVTSVFDLLYASYADELKDTLDKIPSFFSPVVSENLYANFVLKSVLEKHQLQDRIHIENEYPLQYIIDFSRDLPEEVYYSDEEKTYGTREGTHLDFILTDVVTHRPVLAIEIDGVKYHKEGTEQHDRRDKLKDSIMQKAGIKLERVRTDFSGLEERLEEVLAEVGVLT